MSNKLLKKHLIFQNNNFAINQNLHKIYHKQMLVHYYYVTTQPRPDWKSKNQYSINWIIDTVPVCHTMTFVHCRIVQWRLWDREIP